MTSPGAKDAVILGIRRMAAAAHEVRGMRHWINDLLAAEYPAAVDGVVLLACELTTNALRHSGTADITVRVLSVADAIRIEVVDGGTSGDVPRIVDSGPEATGGRGLRMVDLLTHGRWGTFAEGAARVVWCEKEIPDQCAEPGT